MNGAEHEALLTSGEALASPLSRGDRGAVPVLEPNRPVEPNALGDAPIAAPMGAPDEIELGPAVRAVAIAGAGRTFGIGSDIVARRHRQTGPAEAVARFPRPSQHVTRRIESFPKPVIAAVNGPAYGRG